METWLRQALVAVWHACPEEDRHPPATEEGLRAFEAEFGPIPPVFRDYLALCGGTVGGSPEWIDGVAKLHESHRNYQQQGVRDPGRSGRANPGKCHTRREVHALRPVSG
jgi:hypothetical protein